MKEIELPVTSSPLTNLTPEEKRYLLFNSLISNIWTIWGSHKQKNGNVRKDFICHLMKHQESSTRKKENISNEKCRITKTRPSRLCCAKIKILWMVSLGIVKVEPYKNSSNHTHTISESDKNYSPPAITVAVKEYATKLGLGKSVFELSRKEVTNVKYKICGPLEAHLLCNSNLKSDILNSMAFLVEKGYHKLQHHRWLTLINSTYKTNKYDWRLFSLYVRDTYGCWDVSAHFYVSNEDCDTISKALKIIRNYCHWSPRYILFDQNSIEAKGIKKAFPGISAGEQECEVILCVVHVMRTWMTKIYEKKTCTVHNVVEIDCKRRSNFKRAAFNFRTKKVSAYSVDSDIIEKIHKFPFPLQHLLIKEVCSVMDRIEKGKGPPGLTSLNCYCLFRVQYIFPCKHIFHEHSYGSIKLLTSEAWKGFQEMFKESGYEIYEGRESSIEFVETQQQKEAEDRRLTVVELTERVRDKYWRVEEMRDAKKTDNFISKLETSLKLIISNNQ
ncbi:hypothetical protein Glove_12g29 [Diversispora epigaea]|uniref:ZSWIM1/3 RNaseH-like domain-containing protein n=1 Tax=Diversispora epigaea TaxID=1348612 RepID=A0A397JUH8_9GLOM|nr:hypothetical protein Glove_12g29 [Diversispora epigaea]